MTLEADRRALKHATWVTSVRALDLLPAGLMRFGGAGEPTRSVRGREHRSLRTGIARVTGHPDPSTPPPSKETPSASAPSPHAALST